MNRQTLSQFTSTAWSGDEGLDGLEVVIAAIAEGAGRVHEQVQAAALADVLGTTGKTNVQGEVVQKLDSAGSDIFVDVLSKSGRVAAVGSEEIEEAVIEDNDPRQIYIVQMDPIDGSSNIDVAISIGSIFGIWRRAGSGPVTDASLLRPGNEQVAAAYLIYGSSTVLVVATRGSVNGFTLDPETRAFALTHENIKIPEKCEYYSTNEGNFNRLSERMQSVVTKLRAGHSLRYVGSLVADFHRNLLKGGIFLYPSDAKSPDGKLRLMYEANPLGFVAEQAGGAASDGEQRILDIQPKHLHQRVPLIIGNKAEVDDSVLMATGVSSRS